MMKIKVIKKYKVDFKAYKLDNIRFIEENRI